MTKRPAQIRDCYNGCMLGLTLAAAGFKHHARDYPTHRRRMQELLDELGVPIALPKRHAQYVDNWANLTDEILSTDMATESTCLAWAAFMNNATWSTLKRGGPGAASFRKHALAFLDACDLPRTLLTDMAKACPREKNGGTSIQKLLSAALALLDRIIARAPTEPRLAIVAMPFSPATMLERYTSVYAPIAEGIAYRPIRAWGGFGMESYQALLRTIISKCGAMIADITGQNANVMHELGYALSHKHMFILAIREKGQKVPANLGDLTVVPYELKRTNWREIAVSQMIALVLAYEEAMRMVDPRLKRRRITGPLRLVD